MPDALTYENTITERSMRGQDTALNNGAVVTSVLLKQYHAAFVLRVPL